MYAFVILIISPLINSVPTVGLYRHEACMCIYDLSLQILIFNIGIQKSTDRLVSLCEFSSVILVIAIHFILVNGVVAMTTTFLRQGLAGTPGTQGREAVGLYTKLDFVTPFRWRFALKVLCQSLNLHT